MVILQKRFLRIVADVIVDCSADVSQRPNYDIMSTETATDLVPNNSRIDEQPVWLCSFRGVQGLPCRGEERERGDQVRRGSPLHMKRPVDDKSSPRRR